MTSRPWPKPAGEIHQRQPGCSEAWPFVTFWEMKRSKGKRLRHVFCRQFSSPPRRQEHSNCVRAGAFPCLSVVVHPTGNHGSFHREKFRLTFNAAIGLLRIASDRLKYPQNGLPVFTLNLLHHFCFPNLGEFSSRAFVVSGGR